VKQIKNSSEEIERNNNGDVQLCKM